jgi:hypothetical protein
LKKAAQKLSLLWSRDFRTPEAQNQRSLFGSFSSEKEVRSPLNRPVTQNRGAAHPPVLREVVGQRVMLGESIVPERNRAGLPAPANLEFGCF